MTNDKTQFAQFVNTALEVLGVAVSAAPETQRHVAAPSPPFRAQLADSLPLPDAPPGDGPGVGVETQRPSNVVRGMDGIESLQDGWDSYGGKKPTDAAMRAVRTMQAVPVSDGGIQLDWGDDTVAIGPDGKVVDEQRPAVDVEGLARHLRNRSVELGGLGNWGWGDIAQAAVEFLNKTGGRP